ncbi:protein kinase family protein [Enterococcus faecium]|uniref:protein kinase family protein n=1 Tax=Enterococcus thailandicus TaxID=417368 RepID=UPI002A4DF06D|nr:protein kinase family protein [Enterococcus faecium]MDB7374869.1 protein kinase family protein [Enterococcus faecium]MDB7382907.1 protein kinase family protein [Enterococcus faecium]MDB7397864.1 protein kinase family protein [Enterococcus faecium]MDB7563113.1 protein kinase family protein [Enterococcus faecium]
MNIDYILDENVVFLTEFTSKIMGQLPEERLYENVEDNRLRFCFAVFQNQFNSLFSFLNEKTNYNNHFNADPSRELIILVDKYEEFEHALSRTDYAFKMIDNYVDTIRFIQPHLSNSGGSTIPEDYQLLNIVKYEPIIYFEKRIEIVKESSSLYSSLKLVNSGSYAMVYKFKDTFYNQTFALKRARKELTSTELIRFNKEFENMKNMDSLYVLKVYSYNDDVNEFIMEYVQQTLKEYIDSNNTKLQLFERKRLVTQLFNAFKYIHSKGIFHRDISLSNILVKEYDDKTIILKVCDFGYLKDSDSTLTRQNTEFQGSLNDPHLKIMGADKYTIQHEIYALTLVIFYIMTGRKNLNNNKNKEIEKFIDSGVNADLSKRVKTLEELKELYLRTDWN